ncbi:unnamed protein product [Sphagnum tenellum]
MRTVSGNEDQEPVTVPGEEAVGEIDGVGEAPGRDQELQGERCWLDFVWQSSCSPCLPFAKAARLPP